MFRWGGCDNSFQQLLLKNQYFIRQNNFIVILFCYLASALPQKYTIFSVQFCCSQRIKFKTTEKSETDSVFLCSYFAREKFHRFAYSGFTVLYLMFQRNWSLWLRLYLWWLDRKWFRCIKSSYSFKQTYRKLA